MTPHTPVDTLESIVADIRKLIAHCEERSAELKGREQAEPERKTELRAHWVGYDCEAEALQRFADRLASLPVEGWRTVPVEPTEAMVEAGMHGCDGRLYPADMHIGPRAQLRDKYRAMIAAAPQDQRQGNEQGGTHE